MRFEDIHVGDSAELSRTVTGDDILRFAEVTGDNNPIHVDENAARATRFGGRIAHGMLLGGYVSAVLGMRLPGPGAICLGQTMRFVQPVRIGDTVTARVEVSETVPGKRRLRLATTCTNQLGVVVMDGEATILMPAP